MTTRFVLCGNCKRLHLDGKRQCEAFPKGIPEDILSGDFNHIKKHPDQKDNDLVFEPIEEA